MSINSNYFLNWTCNLLAHFCTFFGAIASLFICHVNGLFMGSNTIRGCVGSYGDVVWSMYAIDIYSKGKLDVGRECHVKGSLTQFQICEYHYSMRL